MLRIIEIDSYENVALPSKCVEPAEDIGHLLISLEGRHLTFSTLHQFGSNITTRTVLYERFHSFSKLRHWCLV